MTENPFKFGKIVVGPDFIGRERELKEIGSDVRSSQNVILYSRRRLGKSSLINELFRRMEDDVIPVYVDMYNVWTVEDLVEELIGRTLSKAYGPMEKAISMAGEALRSLRPRIILESGAIHVEVEHLRRDHDLKEALNFPQKVAEKKGKRVIVAFDEFQEITHLDGDQLERAMRSVLQHHDKVSYIFAGSRTHMLKEIFEHKDRAFYHFGKIMTMGNIETTDFKPAIMARFESTTGSIPVSIVERVLEVTRGHPYNTQQLCHELWYMSLEGALKVDSIEAALEKVIEHKNDLYEHIWNSMRSSVQKELLVALAEDQSMDIYSQSAIAKYQLKSSSNVQKAYNALVKKDLLEGTEYTDPMFRAWILDRISKP